MFPYARWDTQLHAWKRPQPVLRRDPDLYLNWAPLSVPSGTRTCAQTGPRSVPEGDPDLYVEGTLTCAWDPGLCFDGAHIYA